MGIDQIVCKYGIKRSNVLGSHSQHTLLVQIDDRLCVACHFRSPPNPTCAGGVRPGPSSSNVPAAPGPPTDMARRDGATIWMKAHNASRREAPYRPTVNNVPGA